MAAKTVKKKFGTTPLWSMLSGGRAPPKPTALRPMVPVILAKNTVPAAVLLEAAVKEQCLRQVNWLTASWMPQEPSTRMNARAEAGKAFPLKLMSKADRA